MDINKKIAKMNKGKLIIGVISTIALGLLAFSTFITKVGNTETVDTKVVQSINYKKELSPSTDIQYKSLVNLSFSLNNIEYEIQTTKGGTFYKGDTITINVNKNNPNKLVGSSPYVDLGCSIFFFTIALGLLFLSDKIMDIIKRLFYKKENKNENTELYIDVAHEKKINRKWDNLSLLLTSLVVIVGLIALVIWGIHESVTYYNFKQKEIINKSVTIKTIDDMIVGYWIDDNNVEHLDFISMAEDNTIYTEGDTIIMEVEKNTTDSKKISIPPSIFDIDKPIISVVFFTIILIICFASKKKSNCHIP